MDKIYKIKEGFIIKNISDEYVVIPTGKGMVDFKLMLTLNETGAWMWERLHKGISKKQLLEDLLSEFDADESTALSDIEEFINVLLDKCLIEE